MNAHHYAATPTLSVMDPRTLAVRSVGYCRHPDSPLIDPRITRQRFDVAGHLIESWDPRLWGTAPKPNLTTVYGLSGQPLLMDSVDGGWQLGLPDQAGSPCSFWDARGSQRHTEFDEQQRALTVTEQAAGERPRVVERLTYGGSDPVFAAHNQCGQLIRHDHPAGTQVIRDYGLSGAVLVEEQRFLADLETPDWPLNVDERERWLEAQSFITRHSFNPGGELQRQTDAMGNVRTFGYDRAGKLSEVWLHMAGEGKHPQRLVSAIRYNAQDQIESESAGNGVVTRAEYAADDGRLLRLLAALGSQKPLQDLKYVYDSVGNIVELQNLSEAVSHFNNQRIDPINRYRYDSLYQLVEARGWEVSQPSHGPTLPALLPTPLDPNQRRNYTQRFEYDRGGNLITRHHSGAPGFSMFTSARSNRSLGQRDDGSLPGEPEIAMGFDACGNQQELQRGQAMLWDSRNQLHQVTLVKRETGPDDYEGYRYDRPSHRSRKVGFAHSSGRTLRSEVRYLPGLEIHRQAEGEEHHVISVEAGRSNVRALHWPQGAHSDQVRYGLSDHLGSGTLELDDEAGVLTQEHYYPFGGTACWAGKSALVAQYKTLRYSGKERDATGLYYYGYRYYAPWLQRWVSPDPIGDRDGPNHYAMVGNNPINFIDRFGLAGQQASGTRLLFEAAFVVLFMTAVGYGLGWLAGYGGEGAMGGALVGGAMAGSDLWRAYQRPRAIAKQREMLIRQYDESLRNRIMERSASLDLTADETERYLKFVSDWSTSDREITYSIQNTKAGIFAYVGPLDKKAEAQSVLGSDRNPVKGLKRLGFSVQLIRSPEREQSATPAQSGQPAQFQLGSPVSISNQRRRAQTSSTDSTPSQVQRAATKSVQHLEIDTQEVDTILGNPSDPRHKSISSAINSLREGRTGALSWHRHQDGLWSADLRGFPGSTKRGVHRLMLSHQGGVHYRVEGIRNPH
ncbi:RHS repeat domain-containing protein [Pseudomonas baetica]|uniref:RHS repeat domain-containing protein n=1 Tax=Pseudomonas baetica TaxID=674054 RepID=UPI0024063F70|nr:RHS repeat-associated core domain-containing protein [Pseudomonas baetica]MDF9773956.1 insecticidal toxin complex protein TccC [Pseudomonas baetica]